MTVYFISLSGDEICRMNLADFKVKSISQLKSKGPRDRLFIKTSNADPAKCAVLMGSEFMGVEVIGGGFKDNGTNPESVVSNLDFEAIPQGESPDDEYNWFQDTMFLIEPAHEQLEILWAFGPSMDFVLLTKPQERKFGLTMKRHLVNGSSDHAFTSLETKPFFNWA